MSPWCFTSNGACLGGHWALDWDPHCYKTCFSFALLLLGSTMLSGSFIRWRQAGATNKHTEPQSKPLKMWETFKLSNNQVCPCWKCHSCDWNTGRIIRASTGLQEWVFLCLHAFNVHLEQIIKEVKATNIYNEQEINTFTDMLSSSNVACTAQRGHKGCLLNQRQSKNNWHPVDMTRRLLAILPSLI